MEINDLWAILSQKESFYINDIKCFCKYQGFLKKSKINLFALKCPNKNAVKGRFPLRIYRVCFFANKTYITVMLYSPMDSVQNE